MDNLSMAFSTNNAHFPITENLVSKTYRLNRHYKGKIVTGINDNLSNRDLYVAKAKGILLDKINDMDDTLYLKRMKSIDRNYTINERKK